MPLRQKFISFEQISIRFTYTLFELIQMLFNSNKSCLNQNNPLKKIIFIHSIKSFFSVCDKSIHILQ